ncbi:MAG: Putative HNH endonuclease [Lactobacillus delbrueckii]|jgi:5-methylcytosine-specific restriction endonuclease McrA
MILMSLDKKPKVWNGKQVAKEEKKSERFGTNNNEFYRSASWRSIRQQVLQRDMHLCQICKAEGRYTLGDTVHHIEPLRKTGDDSYKAFSMDNLITVCRQCHNRLHREKGMKLQKKIRYIKPDDKTEVFKPNDEIW